MLLKGPLASLERHDRPACEGRSGSERSTEPGSSAKTVASQPVVGYRIRPRTAKKEILGSRISPSSDSANGRTARDTTEVSRVKRTIRPETAAAADVCANLRAT